MKPSLKVIVSGFIIGTLILTGVSAYLAKASTTIGSDIQTGNLTINGSASTTGDLNIGGTGIFGTGLSLPSVKYISCSGSNDQVGVNNAFAAGGSTVVISGTCVVASPITPTSNSVLRGNGANAVIKAISGSTSYRLVNVIGVSNVTIEDLVIDGNGDAETGVLVALAVENSNKVNVNRVIIRNGSVVGQGYGGFVTNSYDVHFSNSTFGPWGNSPFEWRPGSYNSTVTNSRFEGAVGQATQLQLYPTIGPGLLIDGNEFHNVGIGAGTQLPLPTGLIITNNHFSNDASWGYDAGIGIWGTHVIFEGNEVDFTNPASPTSNVGIYGSDYTILGNTFFGDNGVSISATEVRFIGNHVHFSNPYGQGILTNGSTAVGQWTVSENTFEFTGASSGATRGVSLTHASSIYDIRNNIFKNVDVGVYASNVVKNLAVGSNRYNNVSTPVSDSSVPSYPSGIFGSISIPTLATPAAPTVTPQSAGGATWGYKIIAALDDGRTSVASPEGTTSAGSANLTAANSGNVLTWTAVSGARQYRIYRTTSGGNPGTTGFIAAVAATTYTDAGVIGDGSDVPVIATAGTLMFGNTGIGSGGSNWINVGIDGAGGWKNVSVPNLYQNGSGWAFVGNELDLAGTLPLLWSSSSNYYDSKDVGLVRESAGVLKVTNGGAGIGAINAPNGIFVGTPGWTTGSGAPAGSCVTGSLYTRTDGTAGATLYVCEATTWAAK